LEEIKALDKLEQKLQANKKIKGVLVPGEFKENVFVTPFFYKGLMEICNRLDVAFILDESKSALFQGEVWAHRQWGAWIKEHPMDFMIFGTTMLCNGFFQQPKHRVKVDQFHGN